MTKILKAKKISTMGELDKTYGQSYWGTTYDQEMPVKFNLPDTLDIPDGAKIQAEEYTIRTSAKGTEYMHLKTVKVEGATTQTTIVPPPNDVIKALEILLDRTGEILERVKSLEGITDEATAREIFPDEE